MKTAKLLSAVLATMVVIVTMTVDASAQCPFALTHSPTPQSGLMRGQITIDGIAATEDDCIAAFDPDGQCVGVGTIIVSSGDAGFNMQIYGNDLTTDTIDEGMDPGDVFTLRLYDQSADAILEYDPDFDCWTNTNSFPLPDSCGDAGQVYNFTSPGECPFEIYAVTPQAGLMRGQVTICGEPGEEADCIAAFDSTGTCVGTAPLVLVQDAATFSMQIYGDDLTTANDKEGMIEGEYFTLQLFASSSGQVIEYPDSFWCWTNTNSFPLPDPCGDGSQVYDFGVECDSCANDTVAPTLSGCPSDTAVICLAKIPNPSNVEAADNCPDVNLQYTETDNTGGIPCGGTIERLWVATDAAGNADTCIQIITVDDTEAPVVECPSDIVVEEDSPGAGAVVDFADANASDNCDADPTVTQIAGDPSGSTFPVGVHTITFEAVDECGNADTCSFTIEVTEGQVPVVAVCQDVLVDADASCQADVTAEDVDNGSTGYTTLTLEPAGPYELGDTQVMLIASNDEGEADTCAALITVQDNTPPTITCEGDWNSQNDPGECGAAVDFESNNWATATDNCDQDVTITFGPPSGFFPHGTTPVMAIATDSSGNADTCNFNVFIFDDEDPVISCPGDITVNEDVQGGGTAVVNYSDPTATDNCDADPTIEQTAGLASGSAFPVGVTTNTFVATDSSGNADTCSFDVTVNPLSDELVARCQNVTVDADSNCEGNVTPEMVDNGSTGQDISLALEPTGPYPLGQTQVMLIVTEPTGAADTCTATVTVEDNTPPSISCPADIVLPSSPDTCGAVVSFMAPVDDNCGSGCADVVWVIDGSGSMGDDQAAIASNATLFFNGLHGGDFRLGVAAYTQQANPVGTDGIFKPGLPGSGEFTQDQATFANMVTAVGDTGAGTENGLTALRNVLDWYPFREDCRKVLILVTDEDADDIANFNLLVPDLIASGAEIHTVFNFADSTGYSSLAPSTGGAQFDITEPWGANLSVLASQVFAIAECTPPSGSFFPVGTTIVECVAEDVAGNRDSCQFSVTVADMSPPVIICPGDTTLQLGVGEQEAIVEFAAWANDNCGISHIDYTPPSGSAFAPESTLVTCIAEDPSGNADTCGFYVVVESTECDSICGYTTPGAFVEAWSSYPDSQVIDTATTNENGYFCIGPPVADGYDLRIRKDGYCPEIVDVECGDSPEVFLGELPTIPTQPYGADWYSAASTIEGTPLVPGDVIIAIDPDGVICGVTAVETDGEYLIHVLGDDPNTEMDEGAEPGDEITLYYNCDCPLIAPQQWSPFDNNLFDAAFDCSIDSIVIPLCDTWTLISFNVLPSSPLIGDVLQSIDSEYRYLYSATCVEGIITWANDRPEVLNDMETMDPCHGYWVLPTGPGVGPIVIEGAPVPVDKSLNLCEGWNAISYLPNEWDGRAHALASIDGDYDYLFTAECDGIQSWSADRPAELNDLICMKPTKGYWIRMTTAATQTYPLSGYNCTEIQGNAKLSNPTNRATITNRFSDFWSAADMSETGLRPGDVITAKTPSGLLVGEAVVNDKGWFLLHAYGDDKTTSHVDGAVPGEELTFEVNGMAAGVSGNIRWTEQESNEVTVFAAGSNPVPTSYALLQNYPNPFNPSTTIQFRLPKVSEVNLTVYNVLGQQVRSLVADVREAGTHTIEWDGRDDNGSTVQSGMYFYRIQMPNFTDSRKMTLLK